MTEEDNLVRVILAIRNGLTQIIEQLNDVLKAYDPETFKQPKTPDREISRLNPEDLENAGWLTYKDKNPCEPGEPGWMKNPEYFTSFEPPQIIFDLVNALNETPNKTLHLGEYEYSYSGTGDMKDRFLARKPIGS